MTGAGRQSAVIRDDSSSARKRDRELVINLGGPGEPPAKDHQQLFEFVFGADGTPTGPHSINIPLQPLGLAACAERWVYPGPVTYDTCGTVSRSRCEDFIVLKIEVPAEQCSDVRSATRVAYKQILVALAECPEYTLIRMWNYLGGINRVYDEMERYRQFSIGRAEAFRDSRILDRETPVGTGIGTPEGTGMAIVGLAARKKFVPVENPLQVSAFNYPPRYGPTSPKFSRSGILMTSGGALFLISGTAAVVGHESAFPFQTVPQLTVTLRNLTALLRAASDKSDSGRGWSLDERSWLRVYLRNRSDLDSVRAMLAESLDVPESQVIYLQGDICRQELMIEIEGCVVV